MGFRKKQSFLFGAAFYALLSLAIILFSSPLFRVLGFEYSGFIALFASLHFLIYGAKVASSGDARSPLSLMQELWLPAAVLTNIPLVVSIISAVIVPNCSLWDGILFYIQIVYPTVLIALLSGISIGTMRISDVRKRSYLALFWIGTILLSLLPGYFSAKIYSFGWQYGYFPGFVWDEAMQLREGYWISRALEILAVVSWLLFSRGDRAMRRNGPSLRSEIAKWEYWLVTFSLAGLGVFYFLQFSDSLLERHLNSTFVGLGNVQFHFKVGSISADEQRFFSYQAAKDIRDIDSSFGLTEDKKIDIFIFQNSDDLFEFVGTREASITKPWKRSIYIAKQNLRSLRHELVHAKLAERGSFPFDMSWATGLTEGAAVAMEDDYDGIHSADDLSSEILAMNLASGVEGVMQFSGFLNAAPSTSYVLSGSFAEYLIRQYGPDRFLRVYHDRNFDDIYSKSLLELESDWKKQLKVFEKPLDHYDSLRTLYYFKRTSILGQPCLRRIGKLLKNADEAFVDKNYRLADSLYSNVIQESGRLKAIRGRVFCQLHLNDRRAALAILDTTTSAKEMRNLPALRLLRGDVMLLAKGDIPAAIREWDEAMKLELGDWYFEAAFMRRYFFGETNDVRGIQKILRDLYGLEENRDKYDLFFSVEPLSSNYAAYLGRLFLYVSFFEKKGQLSDAYRIWKKGLSEIAVMRSLNPGEDEILFEKLMMKKYSSYEKVFTLD